MNSPALSVVVGWQGGSATACLDALARQRGIGEDALEVLLVGGGAGAEGDPTAEPRRATRIPQPGGPGGGSLPRLFGAGAARARAPWVAFTEACCVPDPDWAASLLGACRGGTSAAVGGAVEPAADLGPLERALALCDYAPFLRPFQPGVLEPGGELPGNNVAFRSDALPPARRLEHEGFWKTFHCRALEAAGETLARDPRPLVYTRRRTRFGGIVRRRLRHGRCFGAMRARGLGAATRAGYTVAAPALPAILGVRTLRHLAAAGRLDVSILGLAPLLLLLHGLWVAGEWIGNAFGPGDACLHL